MVDPAPCYWLGYGIDMKTEINWIAERTAWLTNGMLKAGAVVRDEGGLVKFIRQDCIRRSLDGF